MNTEPTKGRLVVAVILGYIAAAVCIMLLFFVGTIALGLERVMKPSSYDATTLWIVVTAFFSLAAGIVGGFVAMKIGRRSVAPLALAGVMLVFGIVGSLTAPTPPGNGVRPATESLWQAAQKGREPVVTQILNPVLGVAGVFVGMRLVGRRELDTSNTLAA